MENLELSLEDVKKFLIKNYGKYLNLNEEKSLPIITWYSPTHASLFSWVWFISCGRNLYLSVESYGAYTVGVVQNAEAIRFAYGDHDVNAEIGVCKIRGKGGADPVPDIVRLELYKKLPSISGYVSEIVL